MKVMIRPPIKPPKCAALSTPWLVKPPYKLINTIKATLFIFMLCVWCCCIRMTAKSPPITPNIAPDAPTDTT